MNYEEFLSSVRKGQIANCYLFTGTEEYIKRSMLKHLEKALLPAGLEELNETVLINPDANTLIASCETLPFAAEKRMVIVKESRLYLNTAKGEEDGQGNDIISYLSRLPPSVCLVFYAKGNVDARKKLFTFCKKNAVIVDFSPLSADQCAEWVIRNLRSKGRQISKQNADYLVFTVGNSVSLLHQELDKLCSYVEDEGTEIAMQDIEAICTPSTECTVFQMVDAQVAGKLDGTFTLLNKLYKNGEDGMMVLSMLLRQYRILYHTRSLLNEKAETKSMAALLGIPPFSLNRTLQQAQKYRIETLKQAYEYLLDYEYGIKQGKISMEGCAETAILHLQYLLNPVEGE